MQCANFGEVVLCRSRVGVLKSPVINLKAFDVGCVLQALLEPLAPEKACDDSEYDDMPALINPNEGMPRMVEVRDCRLP